MNGFRIDYSHMLNGTTPPKAEPVKHEPATHEPAKFVRRDEEFAVFHGNVL
ncbi:hypothetical protein DLP3_070 [Stenotrophomonas phage vB_SmaS_DLP_3]|nr:hypothetical protein DLP3_070 [Stenotrophomonas phage vB_SmaS_DLP_3]